MGILAYAILLCCFGILVINSVAPSLVLAQVTFYIIGVVIFLLFSRIDYRIYQYLAKIIYILVVALLLATLLFGDESRGSTRWVEIVGFRLQFSEILKPFLITSLAWFATISPTKAVALGVIPVVLVLKQPDLGSGVIYSLGVGAIIFVSGISLVYLFIAVISLIAFLPLGWNLLADYQKRRILTFLNPNLDPLGSSYNAIQALIAVGSGQLLGWGLGRGTQSQLLFLPEHHTDFVFAALAEEMGFLGSAILLFIYFVLIWKMWNISFKAESLFGKLIGVGIVAMLLGQVFINVGMNLGIVPVTGITLPLVSYGGSSVLATFVGLGIIQNIKSCCREENLVKL